MYIYIAYILQYNGDSVLTRPVDLQHALQRLCQPTGSRMMLRNPVTAIVWILARLAQTKLVSTINY